MAGLRNTHLEQWQRTGRLDVSLLCHAGSAFAILRLKLATGLWRASENEMPKDRKSQPHQKRRSRQYKAVDWTTGRAKARFPFSIFRNVKLFYIIGALIMIGSVGTGAMFSRRGTSNNSSQNFVTPEATAQAT